MKYGVIQAGMAGAVVLAGFAGNVLGAVGSSTVSVESAELSTTVSATSAAPAPSPLRTRAPVTATALKPSGKVSSTTQAEKPKGPPDVPFSELHRKAVGIMMPTAYAAHVHRETGENLEVFLSWYIGTFYNEQGLFIAPIFSLLIGADAKWAFLAEKTYRPACAIGYYGGLAIPFTGGAVQAKSLATEQIEQTFIHNASLAISKRFGPVTANVGALYGITDKGFCRFFPMLRNSSYTTESATSYDEPITAFASVDIGILKRHIKVEVVALPQEEEMPWLVQSRIDAFLGFDLGYTRDRIGYQVVGYYLLPFARWPSKKRMEKERDRMRLRRE